MAFAEGQVGMYMAGAWFAGTLTEEFPEIDGKWATAPLPERPGRLQDHDRRRRRW